MLPQHNLINPVSWQKLGAGQGGKVKEKIDQDTDMLILQRGGYKSLSLVDGTTLEVYVSNRKTEK